MVPVLIIASAFQAVFAAFAAYAGVSAHDVPIGLLGSFLTVANIVIGWKLAANEMEGMGR